MEQPDRIKQDESLEVDALSGATFPVSYSILSADALMNEVAAGYDIGQPVQCQLLRPGMNDSYTVVTNRGRYFARLYGAQWRTASEIAYELDLLTHLQRKGVRISAPVADHDAELMRPMDLPEGRRYLVLFTFADGQPLRWEQEEYSREAGRLAAMIHAASDDFVSSHRRCSRNLKFLIEAPLAVMRPLLSHRPSDLAYLEELGRRLHERLEWAVDRGLDWGACHGDLGNRNIHVTPDGTLTVVDFDLCGPGWRAWDLVPANWLASYYSSPAIWDAFVTGYREIKMIAAADLDAVPLFRVASLFWSFGFEANNSSHWGAVHMRDPKLDYYLTTLREWDVQLIQNQESQC